MSEAVPIRRDVNWPALAVHLAVGALLIGVAYLILGQRAWAPAMLAGSASYLLWSRLSKALALRFHQDALHRFKTGRYSAAAEEFAKSYDWLSRHAWVDRYRALVLLDASRRSYREMALVNRGAALLYMGDVEAARDSYRRALSEYPESDIAREGERSCSERPSADGAI